MVTPLIGADSSTNPLLTDFIMYGDRLIKTFHDQPLMVRQIAPYVTPLSFDGKKRTETPTWDDVDDAEYGMVPGEDDTELIGTSVITKLPQIYKSAHKNIDDWKMAFANKDRLPFLLTRLRQKVKIKEDIIAFQGDTKEAVNGLVGTSATNDLGNPAGVWDVDTGNNGILDNAQADIDAAVNYFAGLGLADRPIDIVLTSYAFLILKNTPMPNRASTNLELALAKLNGGRIMMTNNIQSATVSANANSMLAVVDMPPDEAGWGLLSSGIQQEVYRTGLYSYRYGIREKFALEIIDGTLVAWMDAIDTTT